MNIADISDVQLLHVEDNELDAMALRRAFSKLDISYPVTWAKDGRTLYYASEREGSWDLYSTTIRREQEEGFSSATLLDEEHEVASLQVVNRYRERVAQFARRQLRETAS